MLAPASAAPHASMVLSWTRSWEWDRREELLDKVVIFVFFAHKKYSRSFIKLRLNHWCFNDVLPFWALNVLSMQDQKALGFHQKYLNLCYEDEQQSYGFGTTWGWVINDRIFIFGFTTPLSQVKIWLWLDELLVYIIAELTWVSFDLDDRFFP